MTCWRCGRDITERNHYVLSLRERRKTEWTWRDGNHLGVIICLECGGDVWRLVEDRRAVAV